MSGCTSSNFKVRGSKCEGAEGHSGDHYGFSIGYAGDKVYWPNVDIVEFTWSEDTVKLAAIALWVRNNVRGAKWEQESQAVKEKYIGDAECVLKTAVDYGKVRRT